MAQGTFPKQIPLGPRLAVWVKEDIQNWITERISAARGNTPLFIIYIKESSPRGQQDLPRWLGISIQ